MLTDPFVTELLFFDLQLMLQLLKRAASALCLDRYLVDS